ncbi:hypothetical protein EON67_01500 [archaeon]|nr:MAG: hypothetical protein EON67_01500 [archaeon]
MDSARRRRPSILPGAWLYVAIMVALAHSIRAAGVAVPCAYGGVPTLVSRFSKTLVCVEIDGRVAVFDVDVDRIHALEIAGGMCTLRCECRAINNRSHAAHKRAGVHVSNACCQAVVMHRSILASACVTSCVRVRVRVHVRVHVRVRCSLGTVRVRHN